MKVKDPATFDEQVNKLIKKNISIEDRKECIDFLKRVNYYRLSAYYLPFKGADGKCTHIIPFKQIQMLYMFDQQLRSLILDIIEDIEIHIRAQLAYYHSHKYGSLGYMLLNNFNKNHDHSSFENRTIECINENKNTLIVKHHEKNYDGKFPLWVMIEFFSIGMLSRFYRSFETTDKKNVTKALYGNISYKHLESWLRCITDLRNKCAHYSTLYYWIFPALPKMPDHEGHKPSRRLFSQLYMLKMMYPDNELWEKKFMLPLRKLLKDYKSYTSLSHIGFPDDWDAMLSK